MNTNDKLKKSIILEVKNKDRVMYEDKKAKLEFYIISLWLLFLLVFFLTLDIPISFDKDSTFIGFQELFKRNIIPCIALVFLLYGTFLCKKYKYKIRGTMQLPIKITNIENINHEHLTFLATYIIPLICIDFSKPQNLVVFTLLLIIIGSIYIKTNLFYANPTLALLGYYIYQVETDCPNYPKAIFISCERLYKNDSVQYIQLDERILYVGSVKE